MYILYHCSNCGRATVSQTELATAACLCGRNAKKEILRSESPIVTWKSEEALANARLGLRHVNPPPPKVGDARGVTPQALINARSALRHVEAPKAAALPKPEQTASGVEPMVRSREQMTVDKKVVLVSGDKATAIVAEDAVVKKLVHVEGTHMVVPKSLYAIFSKFAAKGKNPLEMDTNRNRVIAWTVVNQGKNMKVPAQKGRRIKFWMKAQGKFGYKNEDFGGRDLSKTLQRIAADQAAPTSGVNANDKKPFTNDRAHAFRLPLSPSGYHGYNEYYVTHDSSVGKRISGAKGEAGTERLVIGPPDKLFFTWHHYDEGSWFEFDWTNNTWTAL